MQSPFLSSTHAHPLTNTHVRTQRTRAQHARTHAQTHHHNHHHHLHSYHHPPPPLICSLSIHLITIKPYLENRASHGTPSPDERQLQCQSRLRRSISFGVCKWSLIVPSSKSVSAVIDPGATEGTD